MLRWVRNWLCDLCTDRVNYTTHSIWRLRDRIMWDNYENIQLGPWIIQVKCFCALLLFFSEAICRRLFLVKLLDGPSFSKQRLDQMCRRFLSFCKKTGHCYIVHQQWHPKETQCSHRTISRARRFTSWRYFDFVINNVVVVVVDDDESHPTMPCVRPFTTLSRLSNITPEALHVGPY